MRGKSVFVVGFVFLAAGFLFGRQDPSYQKSRDDAFFQVDRPAQLTVDRPDGVGVSEWVPLEPRCGVIVGRKTDGDDVFFKGQLTCKIDGEWQAVFLNDPPPSITWTK